MSKKGERRNKYQHRERNAKNSVVNDVNPLLKTQLIKQPTLTLSKRNEVSALVKKLLDICFIRATNPKDEWENFLQINDLLQQVIVLESVLQNSGCAATNAERLNNINTFYKWAINNGCKCEGFVIDNFPLYDLGLKAERDVKKGELVISVPRPLMLTEDNFEYDFMQPKFGVMSNIKLTYTLLLERLKPNSFWEPYLNILPEQFSSVAYYGVKHMEDLRGSNALAPALKLWKAVVRQYAFIYNMLQNQPRMSKKCSLADRLREQFSYKFYRWAMSVVMTRENMIPRNRPVTSADNNPDLMIALVPLWDMINHKAGTLTTFFNVSEEQLEMSANADLNAGQQLFMHYGSRSNAEMLLHNGFIDPENSNDFIPIKMGLSGSDELREKRTKLLKLINPQIIGEENMFKLLPSPGFFSPSLLAFVRVFNMSEQQLDHWTQSERASDLQHIDCALETTLERKTWDYLQTRMMLQLRSFPTTLEQDEQRLNHFDRGELVLDAIEANILKYLIIEKRIIQGALEHAKQHSKA